MKDVTLYGIAREHLEHYGMDLTESRRHLDAVLSDARFQKLMLDIAKKALVEALEDVWRRARPTSSHRAPTPSRHRESIVASAIDHLYDFPLQSSTGRLLGDGSKQELLDWIRQQRSRLTTELIHLRFIQSVADELESPLATVRAHFRQADLRQLYLKAAREVEAMPAREMSL